MNNIDKKKEFDLGEYWRVIVKRKLMIVTIAGAIFFVTGIFSFLATPKYKSTATLLIEEKISKILSIDETFDNQPQFFRDLPVFYFNDMWWLFTSSIKSDILRLYYAEDLMEPWTEHPRSPIIREDANIARPGGRVLVLDGRIVRYAQNDDPVYGNQVRAFEITELTTTIYEEKEVSENPVLKANGIYWNKKEMHNIDPYQIGENKWIACVDGFRTFLVFGLKY